MFAKYNSQSSFLRLLKDTTEGASDTGGGVLCLFEARRAFGSFEDQNSRHDLWGKMVASEDEARTAARC